jgi:hypothetical protein
VCVLGAVFNHFGLCVFVCVRCRVFQQWVATRVDGILIFLRLHCLGFYCFVVALLLWPMALYNYPYNLAVALPGLLFLLCFMYTHGPLGGRMLRHASPVTQLSYFPGDHGLREAAERELELMQQLDRGEMPTVTDQAAVAQLRSVLAAAGLEGVWADTFLARLAAHRVATVGELRQLVPTDYYHMQIAVGDRVRIENVLKKLHQGC